MKATEIQVGGSHYKDLPYQPIKFFNDVNCTYTEGAIIKYVLRYEDKNGVEDLRKAKHLIDIYEECKPKGFQGFLEKIMRPFKRVECVDFLIKNNEYIDFVQASICFLMFQDNGLRDMENRETIKMLLDIIIADCKDGYCKNK